MSPPPANLIGVNEFLHECRSMGRCHMLTADIRHWFHLIPIPNRLKVWFGLKLKGDADNYVWNTLPMGFSWSPRIAQLFAWATLLHTEPGQPS